MGAKFTGKGIMPDEHLQPQFSFSYDGKRDRWNGYNLDEHAAIIEEYAKVEMAKRQLKAEQLQAQLLSGKLPEGAAKVCTRPMYMVALYQALSVLPRVLKGYTL